MTRPDNNEAGRQDIEEWRWYVRRAVKSRITGELGLWDYGPVGSTSMRMTVNADFRTQYEPPIKCGRTYLVNVQKYGVYRRAVYDFGTGVWLIGEPTTDYLDKLGQAVSKDLLVAIEEILRDEPAPKQYVPMNTVSQVFIAGDMTDVVARQLTMGGK